MSGSGITSINSRPLLIRTYLDNSVDNTYILTTYDQPVQNQSILLTSTNGLLIASQSIYISSISVSSLLGCTIVISSLNGKHIMLSTLLGDSMAFSSTIFSNISTSFIVASTSNISLLPISTLYSPNGTFQLITGNTTIVDQLFANNVFSNTTILNSSIYYNIDSNILNISTLHNYYLCGNIISTNLYNISTLSSNSIITPISYMTIISSLSTTISTTTAHVVSYNILRCSSINATNFLFTNFIAFDVSTIIHIIDLISPSIIASTINSNVLVVSSNLNSTLRTSHLLLSTGIYSTINTSLCYQSTLTTTVLNISSFYTSSLVCSTSFGSSILGSSCLISTHISPQLSISSITVSSLNVTTESISSIFTSTISFSTLVGSTFSISQSFISSCITSSLRGTILVYSSLSGSTFTVSAMFASTCIYSSLKGSNLFVSSSFISSGICSTLIGNTIIVSTLSSISSNINNIIVSTLYTSLINTYSTLIGSTINVSTLSLSSSSVSSIQYSTLLCNTAYITTTTASSVNALSIISSNATSNGIGYRSLISNIGTNQSAFGYMSLTNNTTGSYNTGIGVQALYYNTTGSYNTAIGSYAGLLSGFIGNNNTYIGYNIQPFTTNVTNEIVIGGSHLSNVPNSGWGSNTVTLGNSNTTKNVIFGNVGINTTSPGATLDVRGSFQVLNGNLSITNSQIYGDSRINIYSDNPSTGISFILNGSKQYNEGGPSTATLRNNYGSLRLQAAGGTVTNGINIANNGNVGIGSSIPTVQLDITGNCNISGNVYTSTLNILGTLTVNGIVKNNPTPWIGSNPIYYSGAIGIGSQNTQGYSCEVSGDVYISNTLNMGNISALTIDTPHINLNGSPSIDSLGYDNSGYSTICSSLIFSYAGLPAITFVCDNIITNSINNVTSFYNRFPEISAFYNGPIGSNITNGLRFKNIRNDTSWYIYTTQGTPTINSNVIPSIYIYIIYNLSWQLCVY